MSDSKDGSLDAICHNNTIAAIQAIVLLVEVTSDGLDGARGLLVHVSKEDISLVDANRGAKTGGSVDQMVIGKTKGLLAARGINRNTVGLHNVRNAALLAVACFHGRQGKRLLVVHDLRRLVEARIGSASSTNKGSVGDIVGKQIVAGRQALIALEGLVITNAQANVG